MTSISVLDRLTGLWRSAGARTAAGAGAWSISGYAATTVLRFVSRIALAKLLPDAAPLGTVMVVMTILSGLELISDLGINANIIQHKRGTEPAFLGTSYSVSAMRGLALWLVSSALAFPAAWIYQDPTLAPLILFGAVGALARGFTNPGLALMSREVQLRIPTLNSVASEAVGLVVTMVWAFQAPSAWAMVGGSVATSITFTVGSLLLAPRIAFRWDPAAARGIIQFGGWILLATGAWFLSSRGEVLMLKGSVPDVAFGCFAFASMLVTTPSLAITQLGAQVFMPMMSGWLRETSIVAARQYRRARWLFTGLALCFVWGAMFVAPALVGLLNLNASFDGLSYMVQLLGVRAAFDILASPLSALLLAGGKTGTSARASVARMFAMIGGLAVSIPLWGLAGAVPALLLASAVTYPVLIPGLDRLLPGTVKLELTSYVTFVVGILTMAAIYYVV